MKKSFHKLLGLFSDFTKFISWELEFLCSYLLKYFLVVLSSERGLSTKHNIHYDSKGPNIGSFVILPDYCFGGDIIGTLFHMKEGTNIECLSSTSICDFEIFTFVAFEKDAFGAKATVDYLFSMAVHHYC